MWTCSSCTLENDTNARNCDACNAENPMNALAEISSQQLSACAKDAEIAAALERKEWENADGSEEYAALREQEEYRKALELSLKTAAKPDPWTVAEMEWDAVEAKQSKS